VCLGRYCIEHSFSRDLYRVISNNTHRNGLLHTCNVFAIVNIFLDWSFFGILVRLTDDYTFLGSSRSVPEGEVP